MAESENGAARFTIALRPEDARALAELHEARAKQDPDATMADTVRAALRRGIAGLRVGDDPRATVRVDAVRKETR